MWARGGFSWVRMNPAMWVSCIAIRQSAVRRERKYRKVVLEYEMPAGKQAWSRR